MTRATFAALAVALILPPLTAGSQTTAPAVTGETTSTGETVAVPEGPPPAADEAAVEAEVSKEIKEAEAEANAAAASVESEGEGEPLSSETLDPNKIAPSTGN